MIEVSRARCASLRAGMVMGATLMLGACGGGSSDPAPSPAPPPPPPPPVNRAPAFTSAATAQLIENSLGAFYTIAAADPEGQQVTYSIAGGLDAAKFVLTGTQLGFAAAPDYERPGDADQNNVYVVQLRASDGETSVLLDLQVTVTNRSGIAARRVGTGFVDPVAIAAIPGQNAFFVAERGGKIFRFDVATGTTSLFQTMVMSIEGERGLQALAVAPDYASSGRYFILWSSETGSVQITSCKRSGTFGTPECNGGVAGAAHDQTNNYGAFMGYGPDGKLYVATGDAGGSRDPAGSAQNDASILGKLLRIDDNPDPYGGASPQYFIATKLAKGFRNPRGGTFYNGMLLLADRGESLAEEVNLVSLSTGRNYGWPAKEGTQPTGVTSFPDVTDPVIEYPHVPNGGVVGGHVYRGSVALLKNHYLFADRTGTIFALPVSSISQGQTAGIAVLNQAIIDLEPATGALDRPVAFAESPQGELYIITAGGELFQIGA